MFSVAEKSRVPLYILSASDLGTSADKVDTGLLKALECCRLWDAVLLLDEADVFLEARDSASLSRNELVSSKPPLSLHKSDYIDTNTSSKSSSDA